MAADDNLRGTELSPDQLSHDALRGLIEEFVTRDGTDYGAVERSDEGKIAQVIAGIESLIELDDPVGRTLAATELDAGLELFKVSCPIGVIVMV